jgi:uncharacterized membrane protein
MGLAVLVLGLAVFIASHLIVTFRDARTAAIARLGKPVYHTIFGVLALVGVALIAWGYADYRATEWTQLWSPPPFMRHITLGLMLIAAIVLVAWLVPSHVRAWSKFPLLLAVKIWAFAHLLVNGDLGSMIMFGSLLAWAVYASITARSRTDVMPQVAPSGWTNDVAVLIAGVVIFFALAVWFHPHVIGVPVLTR